MSELDPAGKVTHFWNPVRITFGPGSLETLPKIFADLPGRVLILTGRAWARERRLPEHLQDLLAGRKLRFFEGVEPNPSVEQAQQATDLARELEAEVVLGIGGGSTLDVAKTVAAAVSNGGDVAALLGSGPTTGPSLPAVMVPTTAGTGSEVTRWATLWDWEARRKYSLEGPGMYPTHAILDPELTISQSAHLTAVAGVDALSHALEGYWNRNANPLSDAHALEAAGEIVRTLPLAVRHPADLTYRARMMSASLRAGLAFSNTKTAAAHSLSYPMTLHFGVAHGQATGITLPSLLRFNAAAAPERMGRLAAALGAANVQEGCDSLRALLREVGLKTSLAELGIDRTGIEVCVREGYTPDRAGNNLRPLDTEGLREVLEAVA